MIYVLNLFIICDLHPTSKKYTHTGEDMKSRVPNEQHFQVQMKTEMKLKMCS